MKDLNFKNRRSAPVPAFGSTFKAALLRFSADFLASESLKHALTKGEERQRPLIEFLSNHLPEAFGVDTGEVIDIDGRQSPQLDLMIYNRVRNFAFYNGAAKMLPAESLLASIEVKTELTRAEIVKSVKAASLLNTLRPFKKKLALTRSFGQRSEGEPRYFHCIFAFRTDLSSEDWIKREYTRVKEVCTELNVPTEIIERIYVGERGLLNVPRVVGLEESAGLAFMQFYMHLLNFIGRENDRREPVPYLEYAGKMSFGWKSAKQKN